MNTEATADAPTSYGVIGVGSIAEAIITGLCSLPERASIVLSPRNAERAARLAAAHPGVRVAADNQSAVGAAAVDAAEVVLLCLRAADAAAVLARLRFHPGQRVISVMPGPGLAELAALIGPDVELSRAIPAISVADHAGLTPVYPAGSAAEGVFGALSEVLPLATEAQLEAASAASATLAVHFAYLTTIADWLTGHGVDPAQSRRLVGAVFTGAAADLATASGFAELARQHATPGGQNEQLLAELREAGLFDAVSRGLERLL